MKKIITVLLLTVLMCVAAIPAFATEASFTVFTDEEYDWLYFEMSSNNSGGSRFNDGYGFVIYEFPIAETDTVAQLSWHIRNQYIVSVTNTDPDDPDAFTVIHEAVPTEDELAEGKANWGDYGSDFITVHDLSEWCVNNPTGKIWVQMADADPTNGWGGFIYNDYPVTFYSGSEEAPEVEQPKTKDEIGAETLAGYNFADGVQYFIAGTATETPYLYKSTGAIDGSFNRFNDATNYTIYQFDVKAADTSAILHLALNNQYDVRATMGDPENIDGYTPIVVAERNEDENASGAADWGSRVTSEDVLDENGEVVETIRTIPVMDIDLSSVLTGADGKLYVYIGDCAPENGWGGMIMFEYPVAFTTTGTVFAEGAAETPAVEETAEEAAPAETANGVIEATEGFANETADKLFDGDETTKWCLAGTEAYVIWKTDAVTATGYEIVTANDNAEYPGRNPGAWTLSGSADGETWTAIDVVEDDNVLADVNYTPFTFAIDAPAEYAYYKFEVSAVESGTLQISGLNLLTGDVAATEAPAEDVVEEVVEAPAAEEAPQTFDAAVIALLAAVTALSGAVITKKH